MSVIRMSVYSRCETLRAVLGTVVGIFVTGVSFTIKLNCSLLWNATECHMIHCHFSSMSWTCSSSLHN